jgi:tetratricopeptide (TPR) repeat protein
LNDPKAPNETLEKAIALSERTSEKDRLYLEGAYAYFVKKDSEKYQTLLKELIRKYPKEKWALHYLGDLYQLSGDFREACNQYKKWLQLDPQDGFAINHLLEATIPQHDFKKALEYVKMYNAVAPPDTFNLGLQAEMYRLMGQLDKFIAKAKEALAINPGYLTSVEQLITIYALKEEYQESMRWANEFVLRASTAGQKAAAFYKRGFYHYWQGGFKGALSDFAQAEKMGEEVENWRVTSKAVLWKGIIYATQGELELSRKYFEIDIKLAEEHFPSDVPAFKAYAALWMGYLAAKRGKIDQAGTSLADLKSLLQRVGKDWKDQATLWSDLLQAELLLTQGTLDAALPISQKACRPGSPFHDDLWYFMDSQARVYAKKGDIGKAISEYERLLRQNLSADITYNVHPLFHYRLGLLYERVGQMANAKAQFLKFLDLWKDADAGLPEVADAKSRLAGLG